MSLMPRVRTLRYVLVAVVAFTVGGATVVQAVTPNGISGIVQLADRTDPTHLAAVDAAGNVQVKVNNLAATQTVSGTVSVDNFPATQNVNITGGTVNTRPSTATREVFQQPRLDAGKSGTNSFGVINASYIHVFSDNGMFLILRGPLGVVMELNIDGDHREIALAQRIPISSIDYSCPNILDPCDADLVIIGD